MGFSYKKNKIQKKGSTKMQQFWFDLYDIFSFLIFVGGIVLFVRFFLFQPFTVIGSSMFPTIEEHDFLLIGRWYASLHTFERGDVIVFVPPGTNNYLVKRIVGLPGELIKISDGNVLICSNSENSDSCSVLDEPYLPSGIITTARCDKEEFVIKDGYFVLGDNRSASTDSRCCFGLACYTDENYEVPLDYIVGKVVTRLLPKLGGL